MTPAPDHSHGHSEDSSCRSRFHLSRRSWLHSVAWSGACWLTPLAETLGKIHNNDLHRDSAASRTIKQTLTPAKSLIVVWLQGAPSQLETFDPHAGSLIAGGTKSIRTNVAGIELADNLPLLAQRMDRFSIVRSLTTEEGDHERATHNIMTGYRPEPTLVHPALGSVICHHTFDAHQVLDIPRHVSILANEFSSRGGYLGPQFDAFRTYDPINRVPDILSRVEQSRFDHRYQSLTEVVEPEFLRGRLAKQALTATGDTLSMATRMMSSDQLAAFDVTQVPESRLQRYGNSAFGRGCIAAIQLIQAGVRCVEVNLEGWDSHANNHEVQRARCQTLDPAVASLLDDLTEQDLLDSTMVLVAGEFGRTPKMNVLEGRDHWPHGFSVALAGGGIQGGRVIGETSANPELDIPDNVARKTQARKEIAQPRPVEDLHATILHQMGIDFQAMIDTPIGRPLKISEGRVITDLL